jgi:hypothetical protein
MFAGGSIFGGLDVLNVIYEYTMEGAIETQISSGMICIYSVCTSKEAAHCVCIVKTSSVNTVFGNSVLALIIALDA